MKKLLGISIVAMLAVTPMMANAAQAIPTTPQSGNTYFANATADANSNLVATTSYVKGAYNAVQAELNNIATDIDVTSNGNYIEATKSVAENLQDLDTAVHTNETSIGTMANLTGNAAFGDDAHGTVVEAINSVKSQADLTDAYIGTGTLTGFGTGVDTIVEALNELRSDADATDGKVIAVYSDWNSGGTPYRAANDYVELATTASLQNVGIKPNN